MFINATIYPHPANKNKNQSVNSNQIKRHMQRRTKADFQTLVMEENMFYRGLK
jgi:hypothetical protein